MKKFLVFMLLLATTSQMKAQDIQITKFERDITNLKASTEPCLRQHRRGLCTYPFLSKW